MTEYEKKIGLMDEYLNKKSEIEESDKFCIDEIQLREKVLLRLNELKNYRV